MDSEQLALYRRLVDGPRAKAGDVPLIDGDGALLGPFALMAIAPAVGDAVQQVGAAVRYSSGLDPLVREAAILLVAAHHGCAFEWSAHEGPARRLGLDDHGLERLREGGLPPGLSPEQTRALLAVRSMLRSRTVDDAGPGERELAELVWLTGYYSMLALALAVFDPDSTEMNERLRSVK